MTVVEGNPKAPFSIATTPTTTFPGLLHFTLDSTLYCWVLSKKVSSTILKVWRDLELNPGLPNHLRTLYPLDQNQNTKYVM